MDSYLLTSTRTAPLWLLHPLLTTHGSFEAPEGLLDTLGPEPFPTPTATAASRGEAERQGALLHQYLDPKKNGALFSRREVGEPFPLAALQEWLQVDGSSGAQGLSGTQLSISAGRELGWGHPPLRPNFHSRVTASVFISQSTSSGFQELVWPHDIILSHRAFLVLEEAEEAELQTPASATVCPLPSSISVCDGAVASWDGWQGQGHELPMPSGVAQHCAQPF